MAVALYLLPVKLVCTNRIAHLQPQNQHVGTFIMRVPFLWAPGVQVHSPPPCIEMTTEDCAPASIITRCLTYALSLHGLALGEVEVNGLIVWSQNEMCWPGAVASSMSAAGLAGRGSVLRMRRVCVAVNWSTCQELRCVH